MDDLLQQGITAYKAGKRDEARKIFIAVVKQSPDSERAWGWMYDTSGNDTERIYCLKQMLRINPKNEKATQLLNQLLAPPSFDSNPSPTPITSSPLQVKSPEIPIRKGNNKSVVETKIKEKKQSIFSPAFKIGCVLALGLISCLAVPLLFSIWSTSTPMATVTPLPPLKPLHDIALNKAEIEAALQVITPLQPSSSPICENSSALECFSSGFTSNDGDVFVLLLERRSSHDEAFNFGIARQVQLETESHANDIDISTTVGNYRWLMLSFIGGGPVYYGGASEDVVAIHMIWSRVSNLISEEEAIQTFSRLLDIQISKIERGRK